MCHLATAAAILVLATVLWASRPHYQFLQGAEGTLRGDVRTGEVAFCMPSTSENSIRIDCR